MPPEPAPTLRKRGGQPGNTNRLKRGAWSKAAIERRKAVKALIRHVNNRIVQARMMANVERALHRKRAQTVSSTAPASGRRRATTSCAPAPRAGRTHRHDSQDSRTGPHPRPTWRQRAHFAA